MMATFGVDKERNAAMQSESIGEIENPRIYPLVHAACEFWQLEGNFVGNNRTWRVTGCR